MLLVLFSFLIALCVSKTTYLQIIEWQNQDAANCPNFGNGGDGTAVSFSSALVYSINNITYKKRDEAANAVGCVIFQNGYGINEFNTSITPKIGYSLAFSYSADEKSNITIVEYNSSTCVIGTETGNVLRRNFYNCYKTPENGVAVSRWFQLTAQIPPGYTTNTGPPNFYGINYYLTDILTGGCGISVKSFRFANNQRCQKLSDNLYVNAYCNSSTSFVGKYYTSSDCTTGATDLGTNPNVNQCYNDFPPGIGQGCVGGVCFPSVATKVIFTCSSSSLMFNFVGLIAALFAVIALI